MKKKRLFALLLAALMLCGCSGSSRENELLSQIDELRSQLENPGGDSSSNNGSAAESTDNSQAVSGGDKSALIDRVYDGIDWDKIPEAPASDFGYRVYYGDYAEDPDMMSGYSGDGSEIVRSIFIFDYYGHDKFVKIPREIDGLLVTAMGTHLPGSGYYTLPWDYNSEWVNVYWDDSVFRDSNVEYVLIPEHLRYINYAAFDDCHTLRSISVDPNNLAYFSEDGVLFSDCDVVGGYNESFQKEVYTGSSQEGNCVKKTVDCEFSRCYTDPSLGSDVLKFTDGTYGVLENKTYKYIQIEKDQFKRSTRPTLFRYPEGKRDKSYMIKKRDKTLGFDENGEEQTVDGSVHLDIPFLIHYSTAFIGVRYLDEIKFEEGIVSIYGLISPYNPKSGVNGIDYDAIAVENITIPSSLVSIGSETEDEGYFGSFFNGLTNLKEYNVDKNNPLFKSVDGALLSKDGKILYSMPCKIGKSYSVPDGVEMISNGAFANAKNMTINIPASVIYLAPRFNPFDSPDASSIPKGGSPRILYNTSDITLNVSSKTEIRDTFEALPEFAESRGVCSGLTVNFVD